MGEADRNQRLTTAYLDGTWRGFIAGAVCMLLLIKLTGW